MSSQQKLSIGEKLGYALGDCSANFVFQTQLIFLMSFYTDVLGISATAVGTIFLVSRFWDAVNDPLIGVLADRTSTPWGKYRPWVLWTALPFAVCFVLAYTTPDLDTRGKIIWACVTYNLLMMVYSANNIPYSALMGAMTTDPVERTKLTSWRFLLAMTAAFLVQTFTLKMVGYFGDGDDALGYQVTMSIWATLAVAFFVITFKATRERVPPPVEPNPSLATTLADLFRNPSWVALSTMTVFYFVHLAMRGAMGPYYFKYHVGNEDLFAWFNGLGLPASMLGILCSKPLVMRHGKLAVFRASLLLTAATTAAFYLIPPDAHVAIVAAQCVIQFVFGVGIPLLWAMMADVADLSELRTGRRSTAITFGGTVFALKLGLSVGGALTGALLSHHGYVANQPQTDRANEGIVLMMTLLPAASFVIAWFALNWYEIDHAKEKTLGHELEALRGVEKDSDSRSGD